MRYLATRFFRNSVLLFTVSCAPGPTQCSGPSSSESQVAPSAPVAQATLSGIASHVDTRRGTHTFSGKPLLSRGNTFPATAVPFGFNFWTPLTNGDTATWLYNFQKTSLTGFAVSHQPSTWMGDYGMLHVWPMAGVAQTDPEARRATFSHANETAHPYHYGVRLDNGIEVDMAPTSHGAIFEMGYPQSPAFLLFDTVRGTDGGFNIDAEGATLSATVASRGGLTGVQVMYVVAELQGAKITHFERAEGRTLGLLLRLTPTSKDKVVLRMATSWISLEQAQENLDAEVHGKTFDQISRSAAAAWDAELSRIHITGDADQKTIFYSNLYRSFLYPNERAEMHAGKPRYLSPYDNKVKDGTMWVNNGFWDTYRSQWPLLVLTRPKGTADMLDGFARSFSEGGWTPRWSSPGYANLMTGTHTDVVFADAYVKGVRNFDAQTAYASAVHNATAAALNPRSGQGRNGMHRGMFLGYTPADVEVESAAWHLEGCVNDYGIAQMARALGHHDDADFFANRAKTYVNLFSKDVGFFRGRNVDGSWRTVDADFDPTDWGHEFTEGNAWHYAFSPTHDVQGMANLYGGREALTRKIDAMFAASTNNVTTYYDSIIHEMQEATACNMGQYGHSNEPVQQVLYLDNYTGHPDKTQRRVRFVTDPKNGIYTLGTSDGSGWLGDEDNGQMSAWFIFSALGFHPAMGAVPQYLIGSPLYTRSTLYLENGKSFTVSAPDNTPENVFVQHATLNGAAHTRNFLTHDEIVAGGTLVLEMGAKPSAWGADLTQLPSSMTQGDAPAVPLVDHAQGGQVWATGESIYAEAGPEAAFDDNSHTAWRVRGPQGSIVYDFGAGNAHGLRWYTLTSGLEAQADPASWVLEGSQDGASWSVIDKRDGERFLRRLKTQVYRVNSAASWRMLRLNLRAAKADSDLQVAEIEFVSER